jgi:transcriptional regulator with XRE-family HTH domain
MLNKKLKELRGKKTQQQIADAIGVDRSTYTGYEKTAKPPRDTLLKLAKYHDVSIDYLLGEDQIREEKAEYKIEDAEELFIKNLAPSDAMFLQHFLNSSKEDKERVLKFFMDHVWSWKKNE